MEFCQSGKVGTLRLWMGPPVTFEIQYTPLRIDLSQCEWSVGSVEWGYTLRICLRLPGVKLRNDHFLHFQRHSNFDSTQSSSYSFMVSKYLLQFDQIFDCCLLWFLHLLQDDNLVKSFLDRTLTSRLGIRMLAEHHLALHDEKVSWTLSYTLCLRLATLVATRQVFWRSHVFKTGDLIRDLLHIFYMLFIQDGERFKKPL